MYSDLFEQIGRGGGMNRSASTTAELAPKPTLLTFKAGRMILEPKETVFDGISDDNVNITATDTTKVADNISTFNCTANTARGEVRLLWDDNALQWQWYDRRSKLVKDTFTVNEGGGGTFERVPLQDKTHSNDRIYVWSSDDKKDHKMYWMQDADMTEEEAVVRKVNEYLKDPKMAAPSRGNTSATTQSSSFTTNTSNTSTNRASTNNQVDALSSILENLGMPPNGDSSNTSSAIGTATNQLTLADLQGAMASISTGTSASSPGPLLNDVLTTQAIDSLLENEDVVQRLLPLLPPEQQTPELLRTNLLSPQLRNTVSSLTQALLPDDTGDLSGYASVIANFQLEAEAGQEELTRGNSLAAFLECIVAAVEKEKQEQLAEEEEEGKHEEPNENADQT